ncbi:MAG: FAD-dependent monooxygenase [Sulfuriferula sp.]
MREHSDVVIVGGGPVGAALALALADSACQVQVLEARADLGRAAYKRTLALSYGSRLILERLGVWAALREVTEIRDIHISQAGGFGMTRLHAVEEGLPELGYVVDYAELDSALHAALRRTGVEVVTGAMVTATAHYAGYARVQTEIKGAIRQITTRLAIVADGGAGSGMPREIRDYAQHALLATVSAELPHKGWAYERFTTQGPVALLPQGAGYALVWTATPERVRALLELPESAFLQNLHMHFGDRVGRFLSVTARTSFPVTLSYVRQTIAPHRVIIGNAAHILHPVAGQGFNLGLRDAWELADSIRACRSEDLGSLPMLKKFQASRQLDTAGSIFFTDLLVRLFSNANPLLQRGRGFGLLALQLVHPLKHFVARRMIFGTRG